MLGERRGGLGKLGVRAGKEGFEPSRELYTPYPLSRRVLSATQPPPQGVRVVVRFYPPEQKGVPANSRRRLRVRGASHVSPYLTPDGGSRRTGCAADVGSRPQDGVWSGARSEEQAVVHARGRLAQRGFLSIPRPGCAPRASIFRLRRRSATCRRRS